MEIIIGILVFLISLPVEILYLTMAMSYAKDIKQHRVKFYILLLIAGVLCSLIYRWQLWYYIFYLISVYFIMWRLYKSHISDIFVFLVFFAWIAITSYLGFILFDNIVLTYIFQRILMFGIFVLRGKFNTWYKLYRELWNRRDDERIKSITLRNISLIFLNTFILFMNYLLIFLNNIFPQRK